MEESLKAVLVGAGNLAWHLGPALEKANISVTQVASRSYQSAEILSRRLYDAEVIEDLNFEHSTADIVFLCVPDDKIKPVSEAIKIPDKAVIVHTAGGRSVKELSRFGKRAGVFYLFQSFSKNKKTDLSYVPIALEAAHHPTLDFLTRIAWKMSGRVYHLPYDKRIRLHISGVFANNFANFAFTVAQHLIEDAGLDSDLLNHHFIETGNKAAKNTPGKSQTGPALRQDYKTLLAHNENLDDHPEIQEMYQFLTGKIIRAYHGKNAADDWFYGLHPE